ncbi:hypothetical protein SAMN05216593_115107 [Pseudomonas asturiensis]|uniref:Peptidase inhibitor I78 family protein n=1 Tax=Pseudomonas asturiensis TaxID=1190415 RepID=A0A1M7PZ71_9PSED|nr:hypothetical protein [Pseudomonas asturiensis]SHN23051.1 hypothetical protein SAMN05216593_115107 [Pseudomonas asturiensis]
MTNQEITLTLQYLIGSRYVPAVKPYISELTSRRAVVWQGDVTTAEINPERVRIETDPAGLICGFSFN